MCPPLRESISWTSLQARHYLRLSSSSDDSLPDVEDDIPEDVLAALDDPEAFEGLTDDFIVLADRDNGGPIEKYAEEGNNGDDGEDDDENEDESDQGLEDLLHHLKANPAGNQRRERNEYEQIFDARFEKVPFLNESQLL